MSRNNNPMIDKAGEVRDLTDDDLKKFRPASEVLPDSLKTKLGVRYRGPQKEPTKERITIRLSASTLADFRATGPGWQGRIDSALRDWLDAHQRR
ncbi:BrnA antitoxin family protein [Castellaniella hirudinis]|uniref:BrnA antitoxin family protein n=1 Tax=Castellaniella hirudinis TaxID=1144617 RepID=UPI0039C3C8B4